MQVGQQVVCIDDQFGKPLAKHYTALPVKGKTYTIRAVFLGRAVLHTRPGQADGEVGLLLQELHNPADPKHKGKGELGFNSMRFKPLQELETEQEAVRVDELVYK